MRILAGLVLLVSLLACRQPEAGDPSPATPVREAEVQARRENPCVKTWKDVGQGIRYRTAGCRDEQDAFELHVVEIDPKRWTVDVSAGPRRPMRDAVAATGAHFAINASFFDANDKALGAVASGGKVVQPPHPVSWQSIFSIGPDGKPRITTRDAWPATSRDVFAAVQAGPRLVIAGAKNDVAKADPSLRSGVCLPGNGRIRFFVTPHDSFVDVHEMVELAAKSEEEDGMGCRDAMLFDGGPSAQMFLDTPDVKVDIVGDVVPVYVIARPRS